MSLTSNLEQSSFFFPERTAVWESGQVITYLQLNEKSKRNVTGLIKISIKLGDFIDFLDPSSGIRSPFNLVF